MSSDRAHADTTRLGSVEVSRLVRTYRRPDRRPGVRGALRHLVRPSYREIDAVAGVDLDIAPGESVGYVGPNGAGKSTTIKLLTGVVGSTSGRVRVNGLDPVRRRMENAALIGVVWGQRHQLWWDLPLNESLVALGAIYQVEPRRFERNRRRLVDLLGLGDMLSAPIRQLSLGQRTCANICAALLHDPHILFLDEPTIGLDLFVKERVRETLREMRRTHGTTLLLTSHDLTDVEQLCDRLVILDRGRVIHDGPLRDAVRRFATTRVLRVTTHTRADPALLPAGPGLAVEQAAPTQLIVRFDEDRYTASHVVSSVLARYQVSDLALDSPSIEDAVRAVATGQARGSRL